MQKKEIIKYFEAYIANRGIMPMGKGHGIEEGFGNIFGISFIFQFAPQKRLKQDYDKLWEAEEWMMKNS